MKYRFSLAAFVLCATSCTVYAEGTDLRAAHQADLTGDGNPETVVYRLKKAEGGFDARLTISTTAGRILWDHEYAMTEDDLVNDLLMNEGDISLAHWVEHFFDGSLVYGARSERADIVEGDISMEFLEYYSSFLGYSAVDLKRLILSRKIHDIFYYRASWREELVMLVYVPELGKFVHYSAGEY